MIMNNELETYLKHNQSDFDNTSIASLLRQENVSKYIYADVKNLWKNLISLRRQYIKRQDDLDDFFFEITNLIDNHYDDLKDRYPKAEIYDKDA
jgi:hypothetical protein